MWTKNSVEKKSVTLKKPRISLSQLLNNKNINVILQYQIQMSYPIPSSSSMSGGAW